MDNGNNRHAEIDIARTAAIVLMTVYHTAFDLYAFYDFSIDPLSDDWFLLERITANLFLLLVGVSFAVSSGRRQARGETWMMIFRNSFRKSLLVLAGAMLVSLATYFMVGPLYVRFGILHLIAVAIFLLPILLPLREWNALLAVPIFFLGRIVQMRTVTTSLLLPFGLVPAEFVSVDYFPLFPWLSAILLGFAMGNLLYNRRMLRWHLPNTNITRFLGFPGRHSLVIYLVHQPIVYAVLWSMFHA
ncbi:MAG: heparan-alpha-glucosaminide N-acetyltransferase [Candidatus Peribacteraceae bacterium]